MKKQKLKTVVRLVASLCLVAGFAAIGAGCGEDDACPEGQIELEGGECAATCDNDDDCESGEECVGTSGDTKVCQEAGDENNDGNNDENNDENNDPECESDDDCSDEYCSDDGECVECTDDDHCDEDYECSSDNTCESKFGDNSCKGIYDCVAEEQCADQACLDECIATGKDEETQETAETLFDCLTSSQDPQCDDELNDCAGCEGEEEVVEGLGLSCYVECQDEEDCGEGEECSSPALGSDDTPSVCAYDMSGVGDACEENEDCPTADPDEVDQSAGACLDTDLMERDAPGGMCFTAGCNNDGETQSIELGSETGCGLNSACLNDGTDNLCVRVCTEASDCPRGDTEDYTCELFQGGEQAFGICSVACQSDDDCGEGQRCGEDSYCESSCESIEAQGGTCDELGGECDEDDYCVF